jgi:hypothetical protein
MFDEQPSANPTVSTPQKPVEDMFDGLTTPSPKLRPADASPISSPPSAKSVAEPVLETYIEPHRSSHLLKAILILVVVIVLVGGAAYAAWRIMSQTPSTGGVVNSVPNDAIVNSPPAETSQSPALTANPASELSSPTTGSFLDTDGDGLSNAEELEAGTLSSKADTDADGLGDREEVKVYGTNPVKADTDGDGFLDGAEVSGGYNPNGPGKLFTIPTN